MDGEDNYCLLPGLVELKGSVSSRVPGIGEILQG